MKEKITLNSNALHLRKRLGEDPYSPIDIFSIINNQKGISLVYFPMSEKISGMSGRIDNEDAYIAINSKHSYGRQRFTLAHELYHLNFQENFTNVICGIDFDGIKDEEEKNADAFASYFLAPYDAIRQFISEEIGNTPYSQLAISNVIRIEQHFGMSRLATIFRLKLEGYEFQEKPEAMKTDVIISARRHGYDDRLYTPTPKAKQYLTTGNYITLAEKLKEKGIISKGKYEEVLLEAYRSDIVYNQPSEGEKIYD